MGLGHRMDGAATAKAMDNISHFPCYQVLTEMPEESKELSFWQHRALDLQITTMAPPTKPYWNTTMVTAWVAVIVGMFTILGSIGALYLYTDAVAEQRGIEKGRQQVEQQQILERLNKAEAEVRRAAQLEAARSGQAGHANTKPEGH